jgi:rare lipoprotein A
MNKIIISISVFILLSCATKQIKTTETAQSRLANSVADPQIKSDEETENLPKYSLDQLSSSQTSGDKESLFPRVKRYFKRGVASWYGPRFHGRVTANGEIFDTNAMTAASKTLPLDSYVQVTNPKNKTSIIVRINDRGPYVGNRVLDLSYSAAKKLGIHKAGTGVVEIKAISAAQALPKIQAAAAKQAKQVYVQVGTFGSQRKAQKLQNRIAANSDLPTPKIRPSTFNNSTLYKVQLGPIKSADGADKISEQLAALGIKDTQFVTETRQN